MHMLTVNLWGVLTLYGLGYMLDMNMVDIPQQNPLKYGFSGIEQIVVIEIVIHHAVTIRL